MCRAVEEERAMLRAQLEYAGAAEGLADSHLAADVASLRHQLDQQGGGTRDELESLQVSAVCLIPIWHASDAILTFS